MNYKAWFEKHTDLEGRCNMGVMRDISIEDLYQAFKQRMEAESRTNCPACKETGCDCASRQTEGIKDWAVRSGLK